MYGVWLFRMLELCGYRLKVGPWPSKPMMWVRVPLPAPSGRAWRVGVWIGKARQI